VTASAPPPGRPAPGPRRRPPPRTLWSDLRGIDRVIVPRVAAGIDRVRAGLRDFRPTIAAGSGGPRKTLGRVDERYARRGVLGLVREVPQLGAAGLFFLLLVAAITVLVRNSSTGTDQTVGLPELDTVTGPRAVTIGPIAGDVVRVYLDSARAHLATRARQTPHAKTYAIADFESLVTPTEAAEALPGPTPMLVFLSVTVPDDACGVGSAYAVHSLPDDVTGVFDEVADCLDGKARGQRKFANSIDATNSEQAAQKASQLADAAREERVAAKLRAGCACVLAVVVAGEAELLSHIADSGTVRVLDPAPAGLRPRDIAWVPLRPKDTTTVPIPSGPPTLPGD
jgi:hypothetical protein